MKFLRIAAALGLAVLAGSCASGDSSQASTARVAETTIVSTTPSTAQTPPPDAGSSDEALSPLAKLVRPAGNLHSLPESVGEAPQPISIDIESLGVSGAGVRDVGVEDSGELEVPGAEEVGWYRWSPSPGSEGSAVLAAHIAYNGTDGVFRHLADVEVGELVKVGYDDGSVDEFRIVELGQYQKDELPFDRIFAKAGDPVVALITCGGTFNPTLGSYEDNIVAYAVPT